MSKYPKWAESILDYDSEELEESMNWIAENILLVPSAIIAKARTVEYLYELDKRIKLQKAFEWLFQNV